MKRKWTEGPWVLDADGFVRMGDQARILADNEGTDREWAAIGLEDEDGFAEVVALAHPDNAALIAKAPELVETLRECAAWIDTCGEHLIYGQKTVLSKARALLAEIEGVTP